MALSQGSNGGEAPRVSHPLLPLHWIAAAVETGNDGQRLIRIDHKHESVGKPPQQSTADVFVYDRELPGIGNHAFDHGVSDGTEASAQTTGLVLVPVLRVNQLEAGNAGEDNRAH